MTVHKQSADDYWAGQCSGANKCADELTALIAAGRSAATTDLEDELHSGDDERLDLVTGILAGAEELEGGDEVQEIAASIIDACHRLDALILATIKQERSAPAPLPAPTAEQHLRGLFDDLYRLFTSTPAEIAVEFGESRCQTDHHRINYALEWMEDFVTTAPPAPTAEQKEPMESGRRPVYASRNVSSDKLMLHGFDGPTFAVLNRQQAARLAFDIMELFELWPDQSIPAAPPASGWPECAEQIWIVLANVRWPDQSVEWQEAAKRARDAYLALITAAPPAPTAEMKPVVGELRRKMRATSDYDLASKPALYDIGVMAMTAQSYDHGSAEKYRKALIDICNFALAAQDKLLAAPPERVSEGKENTCQSLSDGMKTTSSKSAKKDAPNAATHQSRMPGVALRAAATSGDAQPVNERGSLKSETDAARPAVEPREEPTP